MADPDTVADAYVGLIDETSPRASARRLGLRLADDRVPSRAELAELARRDHLCVIYLDVDEAFALTTRELQVRMALAAERGTTARRLTPSRRR